MARNRRKKRTGDHGRLQIHRLEVLLSERINNALERFCKDREKEKSDVTREALISFLERSGYFALPTGGEA